MTEVTNINDYVISGTFTVAGSMKPSKESDKSEAKKFTLNIHCNQTSLKAIVTKAMDATKIAWVNGIGRDKIDSMKNNAVIDVDFSSPAKAVETREEKIDKLVMAFRKAGLSEEQAKTLATKAVDNPEVLT